MARSLLCLRRFSQVSTCYLQHVSKSFNTFRYNIFCSRFQSVHSFWLEFSGWFVQSFSTCGSSFCTCGPLQTQICRFAWRLYSFFVRIFSEVFQAFFDVGFQKLQVAIFESFDQFSRFQRNLCEILIKSPLSRYDFHGIVSELQEIPDMTLCASNPYFCRTLTAFVTILLRVRHYRRSDNRQSSD